MASPSDPYLQDATARKQSKGAPFKFLVPLVYAPVLPLIRISLRKNPVLRDRLFTAVLVGAFAHGFYLVSYHTSIEKTPPERIFMMPRASKMAENIISEDLSF